MTTQVDYSPEISTIVRHGVSLRDLARARVVVLRDHTNSAVAAGIGQPWLAYCPCCRRGASFNQWHYATNFAIGHAYTAHVVLPLPRRKPREEHLTTTPTKSTWAARFGPVHVTSNTQPTSSKQETQS